MEDRFAFSMMNLVGRQVDVRKMNGCVLSGIFCSTSVRGAAGPDAPSDQQSPQSSPVVDGFTLRYVTHLSGPKPSSEFGPRDRVKVAWAEVESVLASKAGGPQGWAASAFLRTVLLASGQQVVSSCSAEPVEPGSLS